MPINREIPDYTQDFADIEADIESNGAKLDTVNTNLGTIETDVEATNTALGTVNVNLNNIETDIETTNTNLTNIETDVEANGVKLDSINTSISASDNTLNTKYLISTLDNLLNEQKLTNLYLSQILGDELTL